ncbi:biopolymer transport protein ExbB; uptake of enterobactin, tonB-dependent uptake of B colicins [Bradyrhizobium sp. ORS 375]|uniref:tonB-system energizer ExbB n=1 Tax=Bradyrhizobium sp. (strain ORS 375) TaxID=566679 RepID=UPI0002408039|nr:tonB-system energizer ExbB [Bradyrhizobium sp. ORS 375]CCD93777.1 biopolymer transport protein ExbB; uptake of enterobactin, tonB-dependent uptake of B colicins [Bradyrhizobium sp. ORS 375]
MMTSFLARFAIVLSCLTVSATAPAGAQQVGQPMPAAPAISMDVSTQPATQPAAAQPPAGQASATAESGARTGKTIATGLDELSPLGMFLKADIVVKAVMIALALASVASWTILIAKSVEFSMLRRRLAGALRKLTAAKSLAEAQLALGQGGKQARNVAAVLLQAAIAEARLSAGLNSDDGIKERAASSFTEIVRAEARRVRVGMGLLATVGAISPFVGLFGTVWGIMNSFIGISKSQTTNLAVVAPGIAEALLATAIGLAAAIPAVIIYNHFSRVTKGYLELVNRASGAVGRLLSRDLDRSHLSVHARAAE